jgi:uncharacterized membrane protein
VPVSGRAVRVAAFVAVVVAVHLLAVWALPRAIMQRVMSGVVAEAGDGVWRPPPVDAGARRIVLPNPDLLYALCAYDVSAAPLRVRAEPGAPGYWSIALYASDTDTWYVLNDRGAAGRPVDLVVARAGAGPGGLPAGAMRVESPTARGLLLMRVHLEGGAAQREAAEAARRSLRCEPVRGASTG